MAVTQKVTLYNNKFTVPPVINAVQNDTDRQVEAYFGDFTLQVGMTGVLSFIRSDRTHYEVSATLDTATNTATAELDQALTQAGVTQAQLKITDSGNVGSTFTFMIKVQPDVAGISVEQDGWSAEEFNERLTTAEQDIEDLAEEVDTDYAKKDGSYDNLSAGTASGIIGKSGETDTVPYTYRAIPHDSTREVMKKIVGATVGWNQLIENGDFSDGTNNWSINTGATLSVADNIATLTKTNSGSNGATHIFNSSDTHVCLLIIDFRNVSGENPRIQLNGVDNYPETVASWQTITSIIKYDSTRANADLLYIRYTGTITGSCNIRNARVHDLTQMLGTTIADYVYGLETATAGAGVAWLKSHFPKAFNEYQPYDAGSLKSVEGLVSHDTVGFNQWDEEWRKGDISPSTGEISSGSYVLSTNMIPVIPKNTYFFNRGSHNMWLYFYDAGGNYVSVSSAGYRYLPSGTNETVIPDNAHYMRFIINTTYGTTYNNDICINLSDPQRNGQYEPYTRHSYPLDPTQELRGIFKLDSANKLYADGDEWYADGRKNVRYGIVDLGTLEWFYRSTQGVFFVDFLLMRRPSALLCTMYPQSTVERVEGMPDKTIWNLNYAFTPNNLVIKDSAYTDAAAFKTAMSGVYLVYELATPTESTAPAFADVQIIDPDGTEEFVTDCIVAVGNETFYADNLVGKLDDLPALPTTAGDFRLKVTIVGGVPTYSWTS